MVDRQEEPSGRRSTVLLSLGAIVALVAVYLAIDPFGDSDGPKEAAPAHGCTEVGCESAVALLAKKVPPAAETITLCKNDKCKAEKAQGHQAGVLVRCNPRPATLPISVVLRDARGAVISRAAMQVALEKNQPNGPDCPPTCWSAVLEYSANTGQLVQKRLQLG